MRVKIYEDSVTLWLSARDTYNWATKPGAAWPCSVLRDNRILAVFDRNGLCELSVNGVFSDADVDSTEFNACVVDHLRDKLPKDHACYFVCVGQFV